MPADWVGANLEDDPRPKITKVLTYQKLKITKVAKALGFGPDPKALKSLKSYGCQKLYSPTMVR